MNAESLRKILDLEKQRDYADSSVFGGLDKFLRNWSAQAVESVIGTALLRRFHRLFDSSYTSMSREKRRQWISDVLSFLDDIENKDSVKALTPVKSVPSSLKKNPPVRANKPPVPARRTVSRFAGNGR